MNKNEEVPEERLEEARIEAAEETLESIGNALLSRLDTIDARLSDVERRFAEHATSSHPTEPSAEPKSPTEEEQHEEERQHEEPPESTHFWSRRIGE